MKKYGKYEGMLKIAVLLIGVPLMIWWLGISQTTELNRMVKDTEKLISQAERGAAKAGGTGSQDRRPADNPQHGDDIYTGALLGKMMPILREYQVIAVNYTPYLLRKEDNMELYAGEVILAGRFIPLTEVLKAIEETPDGCRVISATYKAETDPRSRKRQLRLTIIFQQITIKQTT